MVLASETDYLAELMRLSETLQIPIKRPKKKTLSETNFLSFLKLILEKKNLATKWELLPLVETVAKLSFLSPLEFNGVKDGFIRTWEISHEEIALIIQHTLSFQKVYPEYAPFSEYTKLLLKFFEGLYLPTIWKKLIANKQWTRLTEVALEFRSFQRIKDILQNSLESASHAIGHIHFKEETYNDRELHGLKENCYTLIVRLQMESLFIRLAMYHCLKENIYLYWD